MSVFVKKKKTVKEKRELKQLWMSLRLLRLQCRWKKKELNFIKRLRQGQKRKKRRLSLRDSLRKSKSTTIFLLIPISLCQTREAGLCGRSTASLTEALPGREKVSSK